MAKVSISEFLNNPDLFMFERNSVITTACRYKHNGKWNKAKIDMSKGIIYDLKGNVIKRCMC